ncbi:RNA polymerase sigma factor 54 interaction domain protein [Acididesulfobacillus acetoxydans]|uniref:RNA polymerase sigma factor 54 interaction domain protein n=1 Tax=Acididesulfobacillus acetoxydans TaxID=1561005 RepID=A0A8S0X436_9FIRM|nr:sigma 54-interacting transcriptional regulator [Acididesulfobacillus acetoxydans]CAA7600530.1 RNA polymerase sigma factor 54 interaction domain protein [Acididesulfobacillus acetoxydans]CEJ06664.1 Signal-transduction and transcriptional-control protein [Acididesulfobacillus acetoxydans]
MKSLRQGVIEAVHNGVLAIDTEGKVVLCNKAAERVLNLSVGEVLGRSILDFFPESRTYGVLQTGQPEVDCPYACKGLNLLVDFLPIADQGQILGAAAIVKDVTELETVAGRLGSVQELAATLEAVVENSYEGIVVIDDRERVVLINQFFLELMGYTSEDVVGRHIHEVSPESQLPQTLKTGIAQFGEPWHVGGRDFLIMRVPIKRDGKIIGALGKTLFKNMEIAKMFARKVVRLEEDLAFYKEELSKIHSSQFSFADISGENEHMLAAKALALRAARTTSTILLLGESGTGKEVFAHAIHQASLRRRGPFVRINCASLPESLLESELFGYAEGAFTGARKGGKPGKFELADKGTIFLDEIGDMSLGMQAKLLRVIQEREVDRIGGTHPIKVDVRVISATNRDLHRMVMEHKFRLDLYYRLNVVTLELPPLRERVEDLEGIIKTLLERLNRRLGTVVEGVSKETLDIFRSYGWPGNIRELENVLERAMIISDEPYISPEHLAPSLRSTGGEESGERGAGQTSFSENLSLEEALKAAEKEILSRALRRSGGNKLQAAKALGIHRSALYKKLARHNLLPPRENMSPAVAALKQPEAGEADHGETEHGGTG